MLYGGSLEIKLTVSLRKRKKKYEIYSSFLVHCLFRVKVEGKLVLHKIIEWVGTFYGGGIG